MPLPTGYSARAFFSQADLDKQNWYNDQINAYKEKADAYNAAVETYKQQIEDYNKKVEEWNAGPRTKEFGYKEPTFTATKPEDLSFTQEDLDQFQVDAASRAQRSQANRQAAYDIAQDPSAYNLAGFSFAQGGMVRGYEGGGDVERDPLDVGGEVPTTEEDQAKFLEFITNAGLDMAPVTGEVRSAQSALEEFKKGNYGMGTLDAAGAVPLLGMMARGGKKIGKALLDQLGMTEDVYHYTPAKEVFDKFDMKGPESGLGPHVGTKKAAEDRFMERVDTVKGNPRGYTMPLRADLSKPFLDPRTGEPFDENTLDDFLHAVQSGKVREYPFKGRPGEAMPALRQKLAEEGYTHIPYVNYIEDKGNLSHIMLTDRPADSKAVLRSRFAEGDPEKATSPELGYAQGGAVQKLAGGGEPLTNEQWMANYYATLPSAEESPLTNEQWSENYYNMLPAPAGQPLTNEQWLANYQAQTTDQEPLMLEGLDPTAAKMLEALDSEKAESLANIKPISTDVGESSTVKVPSKEPKTQLQDISEKYFKTMEKAESGGDPNAEASTSSATGPHQFIESTWLDLSKRHHPEWFSTLTKQQILDKRKDPQVSREMAEYFTNENAEYLSKRGVEVDDTNLYLAHFLGKEGAAKVLSESDNTEVDEILPWSTRAANPGVFGMMGGLLGGGVQTVADLKRWADEKMGEQERAEPKTIEQTKPKRGAAQALLDSMGVKESQKHENMLDALLFKNTDLKTNENYRPEIIPVMKETVINALTGKNPTAGIDYEHYPKMKSGATARGAVGSSTARAKMTEEDRKSAIHDAAKSIGGATIRVGNDDNVYVTDIYDFSLTDPRKIKDKYGAQRFFAGVADQLGMLHNFRTELNLGNKYDLLGKEADAILKKAKVKTFVPNTIKSPYNPEPIGGSIDGA